MSLRLFTLVLGLAFGQVDALDLATSTQQCSNIPAPRIRGANIVSIAGRIKSNYTVPAASPIHGLNVCEVDVTLTHTSANDTVHVTTWLPLDHWNNRFAAIGGGAWAAGLGEVDLALPASQGYAASSTDAGLSGDPGSPALWALKPDGSVNLDLLTNFASRSIHDMAVVGKAVAASFYGRPVGHSYWNGCSTGGRQGLVAAQKYPRDFDGILAGAPATYWTKYVIAELWPQVVMKEANYYPSPCETDAIVQAAIAACDKKDQVQDGVVNDPFKCDFDPFALVGTKVSCNGVKIAVTRKAASVVRKIWDGPKQWYGMPIGASLAFLANTTIEGRKRIGAPFFLADQWASYFVKANPEFDTATLDSAGFSKLFRESSKKFSDIIGSADPDLSRFKKSGGKLLVWHGLADQLIYPQDSIRYLEEVERTVGGRTATSHFFRLFLAPGVDHCGFGPTPGAVPTDPFAALVEWVENGTAPEALHAETLPNSPMHFTRKVCRYPGMAKYSGCGDVTAAESYTCV